MNLKQTLYGFSYSVGRSATSYVETQGTLAKSGTSDFLARAESESSSAATGNLIGAFGLGFYSR